MKPAAANSSSIALQDRNTQARQDLQNAAREFREQVREAMHQQRGAPPGAEMRRAAGMPQDPRPDQAPTEPTNPSDPQIVVTPMPERHQIIVGGTEVPAFAREEIPPQAVDMALGFFFTVALIVIGLPISRAFARRMDRKAVPAQIPTEVTAQLGQLSQAVDAIALEVERISEGQRFTTRLLSEQRDAARHALPAASDR